MPEWVFTRKQPPRSVPRSALCVACCAQVTRAAPRTNAERATRNVERSGSTDGAQLGELLRLEMAPGAGGKLAELERSEGDAHQLLDRQADGLAHATHLAVL